jgi:hypothetical protein
MIEKELIIVTVLDWHLNFITVYDDLTYIIIKWDYFIEYLVVDHNLLDQILNKGVLKFRGN